MFTVGYSLGTREELRCDTGIGEGQNPKKEKMRRNFFAVSGEYT
jgi:hypothetical protein